jgi:hypothetical protein
MLSLVRAVLQGLAAALQTRRHLMLENLARAAPTHGVEAHGQDTYSPQFRSAVVDSPQHDVVAVDEGIGNRQIADGGSLASGRVPALLTLEVAASHRSLTD